LDDEQEHEELDAEAIRKINRELAQRDRRQARGFGRRLIPGLEVGSPHQLASSAYPARPTALERVGERGRRGPPSPPPPAGAPTARRRCSG